MISELKIYTFYKTFSDKKTLKDTLVVEVDNFGMLVNASL